MQNQTRTTNIKKDPQKSTTLERSVRKLLEGLKNVWQIPFKTMDLFTIISRTSPFQIVGVFGGVCFQIMLANVGDGDQTPHTYQPMVSE